MIPINRFRTLALLAALLSASGCDKGTESRTSATQPAAAQVTMRELNIAAAADLQYAMADLSKQFAAAHPDIDVKVTYGSSGNFYSQISNRAPFDMFFSADALYPHQLIEHGLALKDSEFEYGVGRIVLWVPKESKLDPAKLEMKALLDPSVTKIAIANPQHAPYGRAAEAALKTEHLWDEIQPKIVKGADISQTAQFVQSGAADAGIIALSLALLPRMKESGNYFLIPQTEYPAIVQAGVSMSYSSHLDAAGEFRQFVVSEKGRAILKQYGFELPTEPAK